MKAFQIYKQKLEKKAGLTEAEIKQMTPGQLRQHFENRSGRPFSFNSEFPTIGRGNVLRDGLVSSRQLDSEIDRFLK